MSTKHFTQDVELYGIGIGPGDPELITVKALKRLQDVDVIFAPKPKNDAKSIALSIVKSALDIEGKQIVELYLPMTRNEAGLFEARETAAKIVVEHIQGGKKVAFITLGDPMLYSTFTYLMSSVLRLRGETKIEVIPGVSSVMASAAVSLTPLAESDEKVLIVPATIENLRDVSTLLRYVDTLVFMKVNRHLDKIVDIITQNKLEGCALLVSKTGREGEVVVSDVTSLKGSPVDYFSTLIIRGLR